MAAQQSRRRALQPETMHIERRQQGIEDVARQDQIDVVDAGAERRTRSRHVEHHHVARIGGGGALVGVTAPAAPPLQPDDIGIDLIGTDRARRAGKHLLADAESRSQGMGRD